MMREWLARLIDWFRRDRLDAELAEELRFHQAQLERDAQVAGAEAVDAVDAARRRLGNVTRIRELARDRWSLPWLDHLRQDLGYAVRGLGRSRGYTLGVVLTLGLGIGANAAIFSAVDRLLFRAPPLLVAPARTNHVYVSYPLPNGDGDFVLDLMPYARSLEFAKWTTSFERTAISSNIQHVAVGAGLDATEMPVAGVSASFFGFFDAPPLLGRYFNAQEDVPPSGTPVVVLSYATWQARFGGRRDVLGDSLQIGPTVYTVIGVAPRAFVGLWPDQPPIAFLPFASFVANSENTSGRQKWWTSYTTHTALLLVRRKPGVTTEAASSDLTAVLLRSWDAGGPGGGPPMFRPHAIAASVLDERGPNQTSAAKVAALVAGMALIVLAIACANVANLLLARALRRRREIAVRLALGVSRGRLLSHLLSESVLLALLGGIAGLAIAQWGGAALRATILPSDATSTPVVTDTRTLIFVGVAVVVAGILTGLAPAWQARRVELTRDLKLGGREGTMNRSHTRVGLLVMQGALSVLLLVGAGLFVRSLGNVRQVRLGYDVEPVLLVDFHMRGVTLDSARAAALREQLLPAAQRIPGVERSALHTSVPLGGGMRREAGSLSVPGTDPDVMRRLPDVGIDMVTPDYFAVMGSRILRGRGFATGDIAGAPGVVVVSNTLARTLWPGKDALGQCLKLRGASSPCASVVGVAEDIRAAELGKDSGLYLYLPTTQARLPSFMTLAIRVRGNAASRGDAVRRALQEVMPGAAYVTVQPFADVVGESMRSWRLGATMFVVFGGLALVLAAIGLYGVISYNVTQRTRELGVRRALGAQSGDVVGLVVRQGVVLGGAGVAIGAAVTYAASGQIAPLLFDVSPRDPTVYALVAGAMLVVAVAASVIPARRAARVDPNVALRSD
jgi:predicted permease